MGANALLRCTRRSEACPDSSCSSVRLVARFASLLCANVRVINAVSPTTFSKSLISSLAGSLDAELQGWRSRRLEAAAYPYLFVDARYEKVRVDGRVVSQGILIYSFVPVSGPVRGLKTLAFVAF